MIAVGYLPQQLVQRLGALKSSFVEFGVSEFLFDSIQWSSMKLKNSEYISKTRTVPFIESASTVYSDGLAFRINFLLALLRKLKVV